MKDLKNKCILLTGGYGFLGRVVASKLRNAGAIVHTFRSSEYDLRRDDHTYRIFEKINPDIVIHLAAKCAGIGGNMKSPGEFFYDNITMGVNIIESARIFEVEKFVCIGTTCAYPKFTPVPFKESDLWKGYPEESNAAYGIAKKSLMVMLQAYRQQYGMNGIYLIPANLYGPHDNFNLETSHVIPAIIRKIIEAKNCKSKVKLWGNGSASREFLHVDDCADAIIESTKHYNDPEPINIGNNSEITIKEIAYLIADILQYNHDDILWDDSKPNGQPRRCLDTSRAAEFGWEAKKILISGLSETIDWYKRNQLT